MIFQCFLNGGKWWMKQKTPSTWNETAAIKTKYSQVTVLSSLQWDTGRKHAKHPAEAPNSPEAAHIYTTTLHLMILCVCVWGSKVTLQWPNLLHVVSRHWAGPHGRPVNPGWTNQMLSLEISGSISGSEKVKEGAVRVVKWTMETFDGSFSNC